MSEPTPVISSTNVIDSWSSWKATKAAWLKDKLITVIAQAGPRASDLDAPSIEDMARNPDDRRLIELIVSGTRLGRPLSTNADVPAERVAALRAAFAATMKDPEFLAEAAKLGFEVNPVLGEQMQEVVRQVLATPKPIARAPPGLTKPQAGVIATSPATAAVAAPRAVGLPRWIHSIAAQERVAIEAAVDPAEVEQALLEGRPARVEYERTWSSPAVPTLLVRVEF